MRSVAGYERLDDMLEEGLNAGCLYFIEPSKWSTRLSGKLIDETMHRSVCFSMEISHKKSTELMLGLDPEREPVRIFMEKLKDGDWIRMEKGAGLIFPSGMILEEAKGMTVDIIRDKSRVYKKMKPDLSYIDIDDLRFISVPDGSRYIDSPEEYSEVITALKELAVEINTPIIIRQRIPEQIAKRGEVCMKYTCISD